MSTQRAELPGAALPVLDGPPLPEQVSLQAVEWLVALQAPDAGESTRQALERWRSAHPDHERAWQQIESFGSQLRELHAPLAHGTLAREGDGPRRRRAVKLLAMAAFTGGGAWLAREGIGQEWRELHADHRTATGERAGVTLADATRVELDTASAIDVRFDAEQRLVRLLGGRILVDTAPDPRAGAPRPFYVQTAEGRLHALGTRFAVQQHAEASHLAVFEGAVDIRPADARQGTRVIRAGEQARFTRTAIGPATPAEPFAAWTRGMLIARDLPLDTFLAELARYRRGHLGCDPACGGLAVSGAYPLDDTDRVLDMLARTLPVEVRSVTRYWVTVRPRAQ